MKLRRRMVESLRIGESEFYRTQIWRREGLSSPHSAEAVRSCGWLDRVARGGNRMRKAQVRV